MAPFSPQRGCKRLSTSGAAGFGAVSKRATEAGGECFARPRKIAAHERDAARKSEAATRGAHQRRGRRLAPSSRIPNARRTGVTMGTDTLYMGLRLPHPFIAGASPLGYRLDTMKRLEDAGIAAIVLHSLFEEQITLA